MRAFYLAYREILQIPSGQSVEERRVEKVQTLSGQFTNADDPACATEFVALVSARCP